jgi:hypothetical protein
MRGKIVQLKRTSGGAPEQWEGKLETGQEVYARERHGTVRIELDGIECCEKPGDDVIDITQERTEFFAVAWGTRFLSYVNDRWVHVAESINGAKKYSDVPSCEEDIKRVFAIIESGERLSRYVTGKKSRQNVRIVRVLIEEVPCTLLGLSISSTERPRRSARGRKQPLMASP